MSKPPAFQFYAAEYLADENVAIMTLEEEGAYIRAVAYCWREGSIPADSDRLSRLLKGASNQVLTVVRDCFIESPTEPGRLIHPRLEREREKQAEWRAKSVEAGRASGKARREKKFRAEPTFNDGSNGGSGLVEPKVNSSSSSSPSVNTPPSPGANGEFMAATGLLQDLEIAATAGDIRIVAQVISFEAGHRGGVEQAVTFLKERVTEARKCGDLVTVFWLKDGKYKMNAEDAAHRRSHRSTLPAPYKFTPTSDADLDAQERRDYTTWNSMPERYKAQNPWTGRVFA